MAAETYNIKLEVGADAPRVVDVELRQADGTTPVNLTGYTALMQVRLNWTTPDPALLTLTETTGITLGGVLGTVVASPVAAQTALLPQGKSGVIFGVYDLRLTSPEGEVSRLVEGIAELRARVSRSSS